MLRRGSKLKDTKIVVYKNTTNLMIGLIGQRIPELNDDTVDPFRRKLGITDNQDKELFTGPKQREIGILLMIRVTLKKAKGFETPASQTTPLTTKSLTQNHHIYSL